MKNWKHVELEIEERKNDVEYCKGCGGFIEWCRDGILAVCPPKYAGQCKDCGKRETAFCSDVDRVL